MAMGVMKTEQMLVVTLVYPIPAAVEKQNSARHAQWFRFIKAVPWGPFGSKNNSESSVLHSDLFLFCVAPGKRTSHGKDKSSSQA